ncbi:hypothetical protein ABK040_006161 [Willaertia magna]
MMEIYSKSLLTTNSLTKREEILSTHKSFSSEESTSVSSTTKLNNNYAINSATSIHNNKLVLENENLFYFLNKNSIYKVNVTLPEKENIQWKLTKNKKIPFPALIEDVKVQKCISLDSSFLEGKDVVKFENELYVSDPFGNIHFINLERFLNEQEEENDENGRNISEGNLKKRKVQSETTNNSIYKSEFFSKNTIQEATETNLSIFKEHLAISRFNQKDLTIFDKNIQKEIFSLKTLQNPTGVKLFELQKSQSPILSISEYNNVSIYDLRTKKPINRLIRTRGTVFGMNVNLNYKNRKGNTTLLGVIGSDRTVYVYDCNTWSPIYKWQNCLKYNPSYLSFSKLHENYCFVCGFDNSEFKYGNFVKNINKEYGFYANNRFIGMDKCDETDTIIGLTINGNCYMMKNCHQMIDLESDGFGI